MPLKNFTPVASGEQVSLDRDWLNRVNRGTLKATANDPPSTPFGAVVAGELPEGVVYIKNSSPADVGRFGVLGVSGIVFTPADNLAQFQRRPILTGTTPATANHSGKFVITLEPIAKDAVGRALIWGVIQVQVNMASTSDGFADVKNTDATQLQSSGTASGGGAQMMYVESGTGTKWAVVRLGGGGGGSLSIGQYQDMLYGNVAQNQGGFMFARAHSVI